MPGEKDVMISAVNRRPARGGTAARPARAALVPLVLIWLWIVALFDPALTWAQDYRVGEGDVIDVTVYDHQDLSTTTKVNHEGLITIPLLGRVTVTGMNVTQIADKLTSLFADGYIVDPQVNVAVREYRSKKAVILGQVNDPGIFELRDSTSFLELISQAGGFTKQAGSRALIKRRTTTKNEQTEIITIDIEDLVEGGKTALNIEIIDGDNIYIPKQDVYYVTGEVKKPDSYSWEENPTVIKAITMAGGFTAKAAKTSVQIIRRVQGKDEVIADVNMDEAVLPDDVIVVPESFF